MALDFLQENQNSLAGRIGRKGIAAIAVVVIVLITLLAIVLLQPGESRAIELTIKDSSGAAIEGAHLSYTIDSGQAVEKTSDAQGKVSFQAPLNSSVSVEIPAQVISGKSFSAHSELYTVTEALFEEISLQATASAQAAERTVLFQRADGSRITGKLITLRLACANGFAISPNTVSDTQMDGEITIEQPAECDTLTAVVIAPSDFKQTTLLLNSDTKMATLESAIIDSPKGTLRIKVKNSSGSLVTETSFDVTLRKPDGSPAGTKQTGYYGEAVFANIETGTYTASVLDSTNTYGLVSLSGLVVSKGTTTEQSATVSKNIKRTIKVTVLDKSSGAKIANATVQLLDSEGTILAEESTGDSGSIVSFPIIEEADFSVFVSHEEYLYEKISLTAAQTAVTFNLEKITPENSGKVQVKVFDEDLKPVEGAKVALKNFEDDFLASDYKYTDYNGMAFFRGMRKGKYYAYAAKEPVAFADAKEQAVEINILETTEFVVELVIGNSTLHLKAVNSDSEAVAGAEAQIFSSDGKSLGRIPLPNGTADYSLKADKKIYVVFTQEDFAKVQTLPRQLWPDREFSFEAEMPAKTVSGNLKVEHEGIFTEAGEKTTLFNAGEKYLAVFKITVPESSTIETVGLHFRVGDEKRLENEPLAVIEAEAGNPSSIIKGLTFNPPAGYETDSKNLSEGDAKWTNIEISNTSPGVYYAGVLFRVKSSTLPSALLSMHYRAYGIDSSENYARDPADNELGNSENTAEKQALYAKTIDNLRFYEGEEPVCEEEFCYSGEWLYDNAEGLYLNAPYEVTVDSDYNFHFNIANNSERAFENSALFVKSYTNDESKEEYKFKAYTIEDASGKKTSAFSISADKIENISLGSFLRGTSVSGNLLFTTKKIAPAIIYLYIIADGRKVFEKTINLKINSDKKMLISVQPDPIPAFVENRLQIKVEQEKETGNLEVEGARVTLTKTNPDKTKNIFTATTNALGIAQIILPASSPKTMLLFEAEKPGFFAEPIEKEISADILSFEPASINAELDTRNITEQYFDSKITNSTGLSLSIDSIFARGKIARALDTQTMVNYSSNFRGKKILASDTTEFERLFFVKLRAEAARELQQNTSLDGNFIVTVIEENTKSKFDFAVPLHAGITIADLPLEPCIEISQSEWLASTQGNSATLEIEVNNNCTADSQALALEDLMAKVNWSSNKFGTIELSLTDSQTGETNTETLEAGSWTRLFGKVRANASYSGFLTFTPKQGALGKDAVFSVEINSEMLTSSGLKFVGSLPEAINATIKIINLEQCLQYKDAEDLITIAAGATDAKFSIDSSSCGATDVEIALCKSDSGKCSGGAEGAVQLSKTGFTLTPEKALQEITVFRQEIAGMYGLVVEAKVPGKGWQKVRTIDLLVYPDADAIISLERYSFAIKGIGTKDSTTATSKNVTEDVTIDASACDWASGQQKASENRNNSMLPLMIGMMPFMMQSMPPLVDAMSNASQGITQAKETPTATISLNSVNKAKDSVQDAVYSGIGNTQDKVLNTLGSTSSKVGLVEKSQKNLDDIVKQIKGGGSTLGLSSMASAASGSSSECDAQLAVIKQKITILESNATKAKEQMDKCAGEDSSFSKALENAKSAFDYGSKALGSQTSGITDALNQTNKAIESEKPKSGAQGIATAAALGGQLEQKIAPQIDAVTDNLNKAKTQLGDDGLKKNLQDFGTCIDDVKKQVEPIKTLTQDISSNWSTMTSSCTGNSTPLLDLKNRFSAISTKSKDFLEGDDLKNLTKTVNDVITSNVNPALEKIGSSGSGGSGALNDLATARTDMLNASKNKLELANAQQPLQDSAKKALGDPATNKALTNFVMNAGMGALMGSMLAGGFSAGTDTNPCNDRVQQQVTAWVVNLQANNQQITMDKAGINAYWDTANVKLVGQYEKQEIGVVFENTALASLEPVYSTATFRISKTTHNPSGIKLPSVAGIGKITGPMLQMATTGFMGPSIVPGTTQVVQEKFHLKFVSMDFIEPLPPAITEESCLQGTMIGSTGESALPKIKFNWDWADTGISKDACIESDSGIYCDAAQFGIMLSKRMKILQEFLDANPNLACPENPGAEAVGEITKNYNRYLLELGLEPLPADLASLTNCWVPKSTIDMGPAVGTGEKTALEYYLDNASVNWTAEIKDASDLRELLHFKAFLMKDNYNNDFKADFADYYKTSSFLNAPEWFLNNANGKFSDYFYGENLSFTRKNLDSSELLAPGIYEVALDIDFGSEWKFFDNEAKPRAKVLAVFNYLQEPYPNSVFYYLPLNSNIGRDSSNGRTGYGTGFENETEALAITGTGTDIVSTGVIPGSSALVSLNTKISSDAKELNSIASKRGSIMRISKQESAIRLVFSPNYATPIVFKIHSEQNPNEFSAFYELHKAQTPIQTGAHLAFWSAAGQCYDFTGVPLTDRFDFSADRQAVSSDPINNWQFAYGIDWSKADKAGDVYLRSVFYTPNNAAFTLNSISPDSLLFASADSEFVRSIDLQGVSAMVHNNRKSADSVNTMEQLFELVKSGNACVTNSGSDALFWWNPKVLYETAGTSGSQKEISETAQCIK